MSSKRLLKYFLPCVILALMFAMLLTGCSSGSENKLINIQEPVQQQIYYIHDSKENEEFYKDHTTKEQAIDEFVDSINSLRSYLDGASFVDTGYYMGVNYAIDLLDEENQTAGNFELRVDAYLYTYPYEDDEGNPIYKYYENGKYYDENNPEGTRTLVNALEIHNEAIKKSDISIEWYNGATNEVMIGLYFDGLNSNSDDPGNILYVDIQGARRSFPDFGDTVLYQQMIRLLVHLSVEGLLSALGLQSDAGTNDISKYLNIIVNEHKRVVNDDVVSIFFPAMSLTSISDKVTPLLYRLFGPFGRKWDPLTYKYLGFRFSAVANATISTILADMESHISPDKEGVNNVLTNAIFDFTGVTRSQDNTPFTYTCHVTFDYGWVYPETGLDVDNKDWYKEFDYGNYEFKGKLYVPSWDAQYDALIRTDMNPVDNTINNVFIEFRDIANGELAIGVYYKNERSYLDITGLEYMYGWIDLEYLGFPQVYDEHLDLAHVLKRFNILINNVIVSIVDGILDPATSDKKNKALEYIMAKTSITEKIEFSTADEAAYRQQLLNSRAVEEIRESMRGQYDDNYIREYIEEYIYNAVLLKKQESLFSANTETLLVDIELIKQMLEETGAGTFTTRQLINVVDSVLPYTLDQLAIMLGIPSAELMVEKTYFTLTLDVDTNLMTMIMYTNLGIEPGEPSNMMWKLELTPTHFGEAVPIADIDFSNFKPLGDIYTYSGTLDGNFVFSSQETVDLSKLLSATIGESSGLNTPYVLDNNTGLSFELIYDQFVTDNYVNDDGITVPEGDPTGVWKREGRSAFDMTLRIMGTDTVIIRLSSDDVSFNNEMYKKLDSNDPKERSEAEHAMGYIWVSIECVYKNGQQAIPKMKIREDVFMASMSAYMNGETSISDNVSSFADNDFNLSLTSIISALCKDAYVVPEPEQLEITSSNDTLQSLFRVKGLIGNIKVNAGFTYRVKGLQGIKKKYYMYQVGSFKDIVGLNPYTTALHDNLHTHFYQDYRDEYEPLDYDFYVFPEDIRLSDEESIKEGTIMVFELGAKKTITREPIEVAANSFFEVEGPENQDITLVRFSLSSLSGIITQEQNEYYYNTYYNVRRKVDDSYVVRDSDNNIYIYWQGLRDIILYDQGETYYYYDMEMALKYEEDGEKEDGESYRAGDFVYIYEAENRKLLFEYDPDSVEVTAYCKTQYSPRTNGSFMGVTRRYYLTLTSKVTAELGALHSVHYDEATEWPPQYYSVEDEYNVVSIYDDDGRLIDMYYDPIALFVMEPAEPLATSYIFNVCTDPNRSTGIETWTPEEEEPHVRSKWEQSEWTTFPCRFVVDWNQVTLRGYFVVTEVIVAEGMMGQTSFPCRIVVTNREIDSEETAVVYDKDNYVYRAVDPSVAVPGDIIPEDTYYVLLGDKYVLTTDTKFTEGTVYYTLEYYEANVRVVDEIDIDPYEYLLAKYAYLSDTNNFNPAGYATKEKYYSDYREAEKRFISDYFAQYAFEIVFAWERSVLYQLGVQNDYIARKYSNVVTKEDGSTELTRFDWSFDVYEYGLNQEIMVKPAGGTVYIHTRFHGQLIAIRLNVGVRKFSYVKFNVYDSDGNLEREDTFDPDDYEGNIQGKYTANYYDSSSYVIGTQPTFVFLDDKGMEHEITFDMAYITGLSSGNNYLINPSYELTWSNPVITNVGAEGSYFLEYVYSALYAADSATEEVSSLTYVKVGYDELTDEQKQDKKFVSDRYYNLYSDPDGDGYADVLATKKYKTESVAFLTYTGEKIAYASLSDEMKAQQVSIYDEIGGTTATGALYTEQNGYAYVRVSYEYEDYYVTLHRYGLLPMGSDNFSLLVTDMSVYYSDTGNNLALTEEQKDITVTADGNSKKLFSDTNGDGYAEKLTPVLYHDTLFEIVTTYKGELVPYKSLPDAKKRQVVATESGNGFLYINVDGHAEIRKAVRYSAKYENYTMFGFRNYSELASRFVSYNDLTAAEKAQTVDVSGAGVPLYRDANGYAEVLSVEYKDEKEFFRTFSGEKVYYDRLTSDMKNKTVAVVNETDEHYLYSRDPEGYALVLKVDHYLPRYETLVRYDFSVNTAIDFEEEILVYADMYEGDLFRLNSETGKVEIRKASVYRTSDMDDYYLALVVNGGIVLRNTTYFSVDELNETVTVSGLEEEQPYIVDIGGRAAIRLGYWYTENEWEEFSVKGVTYTSLDSLSAEMRSKKVVVRLKDYAVDLFRVNDGTTEKATLTIAGNQVDYADLSESEKGGTLFGADLTGKAYLATGGYFTEEWDPFTVGGVTKNYSDLSAELRGKKVKIISTVAGSSAYDFRLGLSYYVLSGEALLFREGEGGVAEVRRPQVLVEIRRLKSAGSERADLILSGSTVQYSALTAKEKRSGVFGESTTHNAQLKIGGFYTDEWDIFTVGGNAFSHTGTFSVDMLSARAHIRPEETTGLLYKSNPQGYVLMRDRAVATLSDYLKNERLWVEYGVGNAPLFKADATGALSVRSDVKQPINRPFYVYYAQYGNSRKAVYIGNEYRYEYEICTGDEGFVIYDNLSQSQKEEYIVNQAGAKFPTYVPFDCIVETTSDSGERVYYYDPDAEHTASTAYAYKRVDIELNSENAYETAIATVNFYSLLRIYSSIERTVVPISVVNGEIIENEYPGAASKTEFPSVTVSILVECPKQDPLVLSDEIVDQLDGYTSFYASDVSVGSEDLLYYQRGYYSVDPLLDSTAVLPTSITVYFEGNIGHTFSNLEWYAYYDESTGIGYSANRSGVPIVEKQADGSYLVVIPFEEATTTRIMTRIGNAISGYKYITVALRMLSKDPIGITFYRDNTKKTEYDVEQHDVNTTLGAKSSVRESYYSYYANTFTGIVLPGYIEAQFTSHINRYDNVNWVTTTGDEIVYRPGTTVHLVSDIREWQTVTYAALSKMSREEMESVFDGWMIGTVYSGSFSSERMKGVLFLSQCIFASSGLAFNFGGCDSLTLYRKVDLAVYLDVVVDNYELDNFVMPSENTRSDSIYERYVLVDEEGERKYVKVGDLVQWDKSEPDKVGLYYVNGNRKGYVVISSGGTMDNGVNPARIGLFSRSLSGGEYVYRSAGIKTVQEFINEVYNKADITLKQKEFDYSLQYAGVETYLYDENNPDDKSIRIFSSISSLSAAFVSYDKQTDKVTFTFDRMVGTYCVNVENDMVKVTDRSGMNTFFISFAELISMVIADSLKADVRNYRVVSVTKEDGTEDTSFDSTLSAYVLDRDFGTTYRYVTLNDGDHDVTYSREELNYRLSYLREHVSVSEDTIKITDKSASINNLSNILNVNDLIAYNDNGVARQMEADRFTLGKYLLSLGTGSGSYDMDAILVFRGGFYYDSDNAAGGVAQETILIQPYDLSGGAVYSSGYNLGDNVQMSLSGVKILSGGSYTLDTDERFEYGSGSREKLAFWYVIESNIVGVTVGTVISYIPAESIYRTGAESGGAATMATVTKEGFYIIRRFEIEVLPEYIDSQTVDEFSSASGNGPELFVINDGLITVENIYEYDNDNGLDEYFATANYLPKSIVVTINGRRITINNVAWSILTNEWINNSYDTMDYRGTRNESRLFAEAYILGYRPNALASMQGQIRLLVRIKIASAEVETLPWETSNIGLDTEIYYEGSNKRYVVYVDPYNSLGSSTIVTNGVFDLPKAFPAYTVGGKSSFTFTDVSYLYGADTWVTKIYYTLKGIDIERMTASGAEMNGTRITNVRYLNLNAVIGKGKTRQPLNVTFYFYDKESYLTEAVLTVSDANARRKIVELLEEETAEKEDALSDQVNVKRIKYNLELLMNQAQKIQSDIVNTKIPLSGTLLGASGVNMITNMLYGSIPTVSGAFVSSISSLPKTRPWSQTQCYNYALYYLRNAAKALSADYGKLIAQEVGKPVSNAVKLNNIEKLRSDFVSAYAERAYNNMIRAYMEQEFSTLFSKYMSTDVSRETLNYSIAYKNDVEGAFNTENLLNQVRKLRRLLEKGTSRTALELYEKQFDLTYAKAYGWFNASSFTADDLYKALIIEEIYKAVFATDEKYGLRLNGKFQKTGNEDLIVIRQTVLETLFARMGLKSTYNTYSQNEAYFAVTLVSEDTPVSELNELKVKRNSLIPRDTDGKALYYELIGGQYENTGDTYFDSAKDYYFNIVTAGYALPTAVSIYKADENGFLVPASGMAEVGVRYYILTSSAECSSLVASGVYLASSFKMTEEVTMAGYIATASGAYESGELRAAINAVVERWFDFTEKNSPLLDQFLNLSANIINYSYTSISGYDSSVSTIRRSLINGADCANTLNTLLNKAISNFMSSVYVEEKCVTAIRQARTLNLDRDAVYMLPTETKYRSYTSYYIVERATEEDFNAGPVYEQDVNSYYYETRDTVYDRSKYYYRFVFLTADERYLPVNVQAATTNLSALNVYVDSVIPENSYYEFDENSGRYVLTTDEKFSATKSYYYFGDSIALRGSVLTENVYDVEEDMMFGNNKYYRFLPVTLVTDSREDVVAVGDAIPTAKKYYNYHSAGDYYYRTSDTVFTTGVKYYLFSQTTEYGLAEDYYTYDTALDRYEKKGSGAFAPGVNYYLLRNVYVVSTAETTAAKVGAAINSIGYYPRIYDEETNTYKNASTVTYEYYEMRADGKYYLTKDTTFVAGHTYYARLLLKAGTDYAQGNNVRDTIATEGYLFYEEFNQSAVYIYAMLYKTDSYYLYNVIPTSYNVTFNESTGGPSYKYTTAWIGDTVSGKSDYLGGDADLYATMRGGTTGDTQTLNQKLEMEGHVLDEKDLVVRDVVGELGLAFYLNTIDSTTYPEPDLTGYEVASGAGDTVIVRRRSDGRTFRLTFAYNGVTGQHYLSVMDGYDSEGYLAYRFSNEVEETTGELKEQAISVFNPFEFKLSDMPSVVKVRGEYLDILWQSVSILPTGNLSAESPVVTGNIVSSKGQEISISLYVASWNYAGLYQPTTQTTTITHEVNGEQRYFVYLNPIACYFSVYNTHSSVDCYLADFSVKIRTPDGTIAYVSLTKTEGSEYGTVTYTDANGAGGLQFIKKLFYPYSSSSVAGVNCSSSLLEYGTDDSTMQAVLDRKKYLLYWDETTLASLLSDSSHSTRTGNLSFGNEDIGSFTLARLKSADDTTTSVEVRYSYESMNISTLQVMPNNIVTEKETDADGHVVHTFKMAYYDAYFTVTDMTEGTCSLGHALTITRDGALYTIRCQDESCRMHKHVLVYNSSNNTCNCVGTECQCDLFDEIKGELAGKSGQVNLVMDVNSTYPDTGLIALLENNVKYDASELKVRLLWNQTYSDVLSNLKLFVRKMYKDVDATAAEQFAVNLLLNWPKMSDNEKKDVIALAKDYYRNEINAYLKDSYTDQDATNDAYKLLAIYERYDFTANPARLGGGGDTDVMVTVLVQVSGSTVVYSQAVSVKVIFSDYNPQGYYSYDSLHGTYLPYQAEMDNNTHYETVTVTNAMNRKPIPQNTYFEYKQGGYVLTEDSVFTLGKTYYRLKTNTVFIAVPAQYWVGDRDVYTERGKLAPYDNIGDSMYKLLQFVHKARGENGEFEPVTISGIDYRMVEIDNVYWTYNQQTGLMTSSDFSITVDGNVYKFTSTLLAMTLSR